MHIHSFFFHSLFLTSVIARERGKCNDPTWGSDIKRIELNTNQWTTDSARQKERGIFVWVGEEWDYRTNFSLPAYPIFTSLSTTFNDTYISTKPNGSKAAPCPNSYSYAKDGDTDKFSEMYTFNTSMSCEGYYDLTRNRQDTQMLDADQSIGSPEDAAAKNGQWNGKAKYGRKAVEFVMPHHYAYENVKGGSGSANAFSSYGSYEFGYVEENKGQVFGLGFNSSILNRMYGSAGVASRTVGLHYGIPAVNGDDDQVRNGTLVLGGYQKGRLLGDFAKPPFPIGKWSLDQKCPWEVSISSISTSSSNSNQPFTACIELNEPSLVLPADLIKTLSLSTSSSTSDSNLTLTLSNDLKVSIPPSLLNVREMDKDKDKSPILGVPFLTQILLFADYQTRELNIGLADNGPKLLGWDDDLECVEHPQEMGDLGLAVTSSQTSPVGGSSGDNKANGSGETNTNGVERLKIRWQFGLGLAVLCGLLL